MFVLLIKGKLKYYWILKGDNGEIVAHSQRYATRFSARRTAKGIAKANDWEYREVEALK